MMFHYSIAASVLSGVDDLVGPLGVARPSEPSLLLNVIGVA